MQFLSDVRGFLAKDNKNKKNKKIKKMKRNKMQCLDRKWSSKTNSRHNKIMPEKQAFTHKLAIILLCAVHNNSEIKWKQITLKI